MSPSCDKREGRLLSYTCVWLAPPTASSPPPLLPFSSPLFFHLSWGCDFVFSVDAALEHLDRRDMAMRTETGRPGSRKRVDDRETWPGGWWGGLCRVEWHEGGCLFQYLLFNVFWPNCSAEKEMAWTSNVSWIAGFQKILYKLFLLALRGVKGGMELPGLGKQNRKRTPDSSLTFVWPASMSAFRRSRSARRSADSLYDMLQLVCVCVWSLVLWMWSCRGQWFCDCATVRGSIPIRYPFNNTWNIFDSTHIVMTWTSGFRPNPLIAS